MAKISLKYMVPALGSIILFAQPASMFLCRSAGLLLLFWTGWMLLFHFKQERKKKNQQERYRLLHALLNTMADFVNFKDGQGKWLEANDFGLHLFQLENIDYKGKKDTELANYTSAFFQEVFQYCETSDEETWQGRNITKCRETVPLPDGGCKVFDTTKIPLFEEDGRRKALIVLGRDITDVVRAENELSASQQQYKSLYEYNPDPLFMLDLDGHITDVNSRFEAALGINQTAIIGASIMDLVIMTEEEKNNLSQSFEDVIASRSGIHKGDLQFRTQTLHELWLSCTLVPILINGEITGLICYTKDVTHIRKTEEMLRKAEKLSVVGELAACVAHEIRNPLTSLKGFLQLLDDDPAVQKNYLTIMLNELDRINMIVSELLVLAKPQELHFKKQNLLKLMEEAAAIFELETRMSGAKLTFHEADGMPLVSCEANQLKQVFINIIKNSLEAGADRISTDFSCSNGMAEITIRDNGAGIDPKRLKHLGEPFYSSKEKGTGLGLTISYQIIEAHRGTIYVRSEPAHSTIVTINLPID